MNNLEYEIDNNSKANFVENIYECYKKILNNFEKRKEVMTKNDFNFHGTTQFNQANDNASITSLQKNKNENSEINSLISVLFSEVN